MREIDRERDRERERERERVTGIEIEIERDRQTDRQREKAGGRGGECVMWRCRAPLPLASPHVTPLLAQPQTIKQNP